MKEYILPVINRIKKDIKKNGLGILMVMGVFGLFFVLFEDVCPTQILFGFPCPGCGLTRAGLLLLSFQWGKAWQMHPFIYVWLCFAVYVCYKRYIRGMKVRGGMRIAVVILSAMIVFYIYRMLMFYPEVEPMIQQKESIYHSFVAIWNKIR